MFSILVIDVEVLYEFISKARVGVQIVFPENISPIDSANQIDECIFIEKFH